MVVSQLRGRVSGIWLTRIEDGQHHQLARIFGTTQHSASHVPLLIGEDLTHLPENVRPVGQEIALAFPY